MEILDQPAKRSQVARDRWFERDVGKSMHLLVVVSRFIARFCKLDPINLQEGFLAAPCKISELVWFEPQGKMVILVQSNEQHSVISNLLAKVIWDRSRLKAPWLQVRAKAASDVESICPLPRLSVAMGNVFFLV